MASKWALVTGASSGIGYWLAKELAAAMHEKMARPLDDDEEERKSA